MTNTTGEKLKGLRGNRTQADVAKAIGTVPSAIANYEQGRRVPNDKIKMRLADYFGVSIDDLFFNRDYHTE